MRIIQCFSLVLLCFPLWSVNLAMDFLKEIRSANTANEICGANSWIIKNSRLKSLKNPCLNPYVAALSEMICGTNVKEFSNSSCGKLVKKALGNQNPSVLVTSLSANKKYDTEKILCGSKFQNSFSLLCAGKKNIIIKKPVKKVVIEKPVKIVSKFNKNQDNPPQYRIHGIEFLHNLGFTGKGVKVGVIDDVGNEGADPRLKDANFVSKEIPGKHGTAVISLISGIRAYNDAIRVGIAPDVTIYYLSSYYSWVGRKPDISVIAQDGYLFWSDDFRKTTRTNAGEKFTFRYPSYGDKLLLLGGEVLDTKKYPRMFSTTDLSASKDSHYLFNNVMRKIRVHIYNSMEFKRDDYLKVFDKINTLEELVQFLSYISVSDALIKHNAMEKVLKALGDARLIQSSKDIDAPSIKGVFKVEIDANEDIELEKAIRELTAKGVQIINTSFAYSLGEKSKKALLDFSRAGGVVVSAAGNFDVLTSGRGELKSPKEEDEGLYKNLYLKTDLWRNMKNDPKFRNAFVLVGGLDKDANRFAYFSTRAGDAAPSRYLTAWGEGVNTYDYGKDTISQESGTSFSAPIVTATLALLKEAFPEKSAREIACYLLENTDSMGENQYFLSGNGRMNAGKAYEAIISGKECTNR